MRVGEADYLCDSGLSFRVNFYLQSTPSAVGEDSVIAGNHPGNCTLSFNMILLVCDCHPENALTMQTS